MTREVAHDFAGAHRVRDDRQLAEVEPLDDGGEIVERVVKS